MKKNFFGLLVLLIGLVSCNSDHQTKVSFFLTDAPTGMSFEQVNIDIQRVEYKLGSDSLWESLPMEPAVYNLLSLTNGTDTLLSNIYLKEGQEIQQIRLVLGSENNLVMEDGSIVALTTPSAQTSGIKMNIHSEANASSGYSVMIDFDAARSITKTGSGKYMLKPVIRTYIVQNSSFIDGKILPDSVAYKVYTVSGTDTITTYSDPENANYFMLHGLFSGEYTLTYVHPITGVAVQSAPQTIIGGADLHLGAVDLTE